MCISWKQMPVAAFADFERILGSRIIKAGEIHWRCIRPFFYRPILPFEELDPEQITPPRAAFAGFQCAVTSGSKSNSFLNFLFFEDAPNYSLDSLDYNRKRQINRAAAQFSIAPIADKEEFKQKAYPVYFSFYQRTRYSYGAQRVKREFFNQWADALFNFPQPVILGGYRNGQLGGVSISMLIGNTLSYATFFCDSDSLRLGLSDLMLHSVRDAVARSKCACRVFAGLYKGGKGLDDFYLLRGCQIIKKPAILSVHPLADFFLRRFCPKQFALLRGQIESSDSIAPPAPSKPLEKGLVTTA